MFGNVPYIPRWNGKPHCICLHTLTASETNHSQVKKEDLSIVFGVKKFYQYVYVHGRGFNPITDHRPLTTILGPKRGISLLAAASLQHWAILSSAYDYAIQYKSTNHHCNADGLSRLPFLQLTNHLEV